MWPGYEAMHRHATIMGSWFYIVSETDSGNPIYLPKITINTYLMPIHHMEFEMTLPLGMQP